MIYGEFNLKLKEFKNDAICQINKETTDIIINCRVDLENNEEDYCSNINNDINVEKIRYKEYKYILVEDNILHLFNFDDLKTHTIEAGDLIRGSCEDNKYNFKIIDSIIYNNLTSDKNINFDVMLSKPKEINASCKLPSNLIINNKFNISCEIEDSTDICPIDASDDEILFIKENPDDILDKSLYFSNFTDKTTLIEVNAGNMSKLSYEKEEKKYYFAFEDSTIISSINKSISFNLPIEKDKIESQAQCHLNMSSSQIICEINDTDSENININITNNPSKDNVSIPEKIINFSNFENKQINTLIAGKIQKGSCENKIYSFYIKNSELQNNFDNNFILELKEPNKNATCNITNFDETSHLCDIKCFFEETSSCESEYEGKDLIINNKDPEPLRIDDYKIIYFANFKGQNTIVYEIKVGNLLKNEPNKTSCLYNFKFDHEPFNLSNFQNDIIFQFNMSYNDSQVTAECKLSEKNKENEIEYKSVDLNCYFDLNETLCQRDDLLNYDLYIGEDINNSKKIINSSQEINLVGFDYKETLTLLGNNIKDKYEDNGKVYFIIDFDSSKELNDNISFYFNYSKSNDDNIYKLNCLFNNDTKQIECKDDYNKTEINDDIIIKSVPPYIILNNKTIYFQNFENKRTYTITAKQIEKLSCDSTEHYNFNIFTSNQEIPEEATVEIQVIINDTENYNATCSIKNSANYMNCTIYNIACPKNIILKNERKMINESLFYPNTTFFYDFYNRSTITIKAGKMRKGHCEDSSYHFTFEENEFDLINSNITFNLSTLIDSKQFISNCSIDLANKNNIINCFIDSCPETDNYILIESNPKSDYISLYPNSIFFEEFVNKTALTITMQESGMIIKQQNGFILSDNYLNDNIDTSFNVSIRVKISEDEKEANCLIPEVEKNKTFEIICTLDNYYEKNEIEILEEPINENYNFSGYKNKRTLTLKGGSLYKEENNNIFHIKNNTFNGDYPEMVKVEFNLNCSYNKNSQKNASCYFNTTKDIIESKIQINCLTNIDNMDIETISLLSNPSYIRMNENITLYFTNFENLNLYTLTPGDIIKGQCDSNSFSFNLINNYLSNSLSKTFSLNLPVIINKSETYESSCIINEQNTLFNMTCTIDDYCPNNSNIDIKINKSYISNMSIINPDTLCINISSDIETSTLKFGYLEKIDCSNSGNYSFRINNNTMTGKNLGQVESQFEVKLAQFSKTANCELNSLDILCKININSDNEYCTNINKDIKIEKLNSDNNYIIIKNNNKILHLYGIENLETFTIEGGELNQGTYSDKNYIFYFNNSLSYNNISSPSSFSLLLNKPNNAYANCSFPSEIKKEEKFDIECIINGEINKYIIETNNKEPQNINYNTQVINFKEFTNKTNEAILTAGDIKLGIIDNYEYYLNFTNSTIDYTLESEISFKLPIQLNNNVQNSTCHFYQNKNYIQCDFDNTEETYIKKINVPTNPENNISLIEGKTITFEKFSNKEVNSFIAGSIEKGGCDPDGNYTFNFINCSSENDYIGKKFSLIMEKENNNAICKIVQNKISNGLYGVNCTIKRIDDSCTDSKQIDFTVGEKDPEPLILGDNSILYYFNFLNQSTIDKVTRYHLNGRILSKGLIEKSNDKIIYNFNIEDCSLDKPLVNDYTFNITINLTIYDDYSNKNDVGKAKCIIPNNISDVNNTNIILKCSFNETDLTINTDEGNYDILIQNGNQEITIDEEHKLFINNLDGLKTVTIYNCEILKGQCDRNNKYAFSFSSCENIQKISIEEDFEFTLETNTREVSKCKINSNQIKCEIINYSLCSQNNDIIIGDNEAVINYTKYSKYKNLYIIGLKNLYTTTLNGGTINFGECQSNNFIFYFNNTKLTNSISEDKIYNLSIIEPLKTISSCTIKKDTRQFDLECIIKGESKCPISDKTSLKIEEITSEKKTDLISPNALYVNNFINRNIIHLKAGTMSLGECNSNNYEFYFNNSYIFGDIKSNLTNDVTFILNLKYPNYLKANCILPKNILNNTYINITCYIEGNDRCPMFYYPYFEIEENVPSINESIIAPYVLNLSDFSGKKITFPHYYLEVQTIDWNCQKDSYNFNISTKFLIDVSQSESFSINVTNANDSSNILYNCQFSARITKGNTENIICSMNKIISLKNNSLTLNFDIINLAEDLYIINNSTNKEFKKNYATCPYFNIVNSSSSDPTGNTMGFSMNISTSLTDYPIKICYPNKTEKNELELKLKPLTSIRYFYKFLYLTDDTGFDSTCTVPKYANVSSQINCVGKDITDKTSEYFYTQSTDQIYIGDYNFSINDIKIKNSFYQSGNSDSSSNDDDGDSISTAGKIILIIFIILVVVAIILAILYYFCFYRKKNRESQNNQNQNSHIKNDSNSRQNVNPNRNNNRNPSQNTNHNEEEEDEDEEEEEDDENGEEENNNNNNNRDRNIKRQSEGFQY